jgi:hypothetical protein
VVLETGYALNDLWQKCPEYRLFLVLRYCPPDLTPCTWLQIPQLHLLSSSFLVFGSVLCQFVSSERFWDALLAKRYRDVFPPGIKVVGMSKIARTVMPPTNIRDVFFSEVGWDTDMIGFRGFFCQPHQILVFVVCRINPRLLPSTTFTMRYALLCKHSTPCSLMIRDC